MFPGWYFDAIYLREEKKEQHVSNSINHIPIVVPLISPPPKKKTTHGSWSKIHTIAQIGHVSTSFSHHFPLRSATAPPLDVAPPARRGQWRRRRRLRAAPGGCHLESTASRSVVICGICGKNAGWKVVECLCLIFFAVFEWWLKICF